MPIGPGGEHALEADSAEMRGTATGRQARLTDGD
jgi:hypothetical protein